MRTLMPTKPKKIWKNNNKLTRPNESNKSVMVVDLITFFNRGGADLVEGSDHVLHSLGPN